MRLPNYLFIPVLFGLTLGFISPLHANPSGPRLSQSSAQEKKQNPDLGDQGGPNGGRGVAGSRGNCPKTASQLTPLTPDSYLSQTAVPRPTFWFYVPHQASQVASLSLVLSDPEDQSFFYRINLATPKTLAGVIPVALPDTVPDLTPGKQYKWKFVVYCDPTRRSDTISVAGKIQRVEQATSSNTDEIWYETITALGTRYRQGSAGAAADWADLLTGVGLANISNKPIVDCCQAQVSN